MKILPEGKIKLYLMEADKRGLLTAFYLELTAGLRRGEVPAFLWADLDMENRTISITKQVNRIKGELAVSPSPRHRTPSASCPSPSRQQAGGTQEAPRKIRICSHRPRWAGCSTPIPAGIPMRRFLKPSVRSTFGSMTADISKPDASTL